MKAIKVTLGGTVYHLVFNGAAMFDIEDKYESTTNLLDALQGRGREAFMALCDAVCILSEHGELARRALGYNSLDIPSADKIKAIITPADIFALRQAVVAAITVGFKRDVKSEEYIDLGLLELEQQKGKE